MAGEQDLDDLMPVGAQPQKAAAQPANIAPSSSGEADLDNIMSGLNNSRHAEETGAPNHAAISKAATSIHGPQTSMPLSDALESGVKNFIPSVGKQLGYMGHAITHPKETLGALQSLGTGAFSKVQGMVHTPQDPEQKKKDEAVLDAFLADQKQRYGGWENIKHTIAEDPAGMMLDASTVLGGAGAVAKASNLAKLGAGLSTASRVVDPIANSVRVAKTAAALPVMGARKLQSLTSGVPNGALKAAAMAGSTSDPVLRDAFWRHYSGKGPTDEPLKAMSAAMEQHRANTLTALKNDKRLSYANAPGAMPFNKIDAALANAKAAAGVNNPAMPKSWKADQAAALDKAQEWIDAHKADPNLQTMANFDDLRKELGDLGWEGNNQRVKNAIAPIYGAVRQTMQDVSPEYTNVLERTSEAMRDMKDMERSLGTSAFDKGSAMTPTLIARQLRQMTTERGRDMLSRLSEIDRRIPYMLAGIATHEAFPKGLRHFALGEGITGGVVGGLAHPGSWPVVAGGVAGGLAASSPKVAGGMHYFYGSLPRLAASPKVKAGIYAGRADEAAEQTPSEDLSAATAPNENFQKILKIESGGKQFSGNGKPLKSPAGAIGASQIMPGTLKEAAEAAGEHPDMNRLMNDEEYNTKLGNALYQKRVDEFGDPEIAAAAYNSNPATVHGAMKKAKLHGGDWRDYLPPETQNYLKKFARSERAAGGRIQIDHAAEASKLVRRAELAKNQLGKTTEPLLNVPDDHIAKALSVANESI